MALLFKERLKVAQQPIADSERQITEAILLQQLSTESGFVRTIRCYDKHITVVQEKSLKGAQPFRDALLGKDGAQAVMLRVGQQELHSSELFTSGTNAKWLEAASVREALRAAGVPEGRVADVLRQLGMESLANVSPKSLPAAQVRLLTIALSLHNRARLLHFDRPFAGVDNAVANRMASLMLELSELLSRPLLVTGESKLPQPWKKSNRILLQDPDSSDLTLPAVGKSGYFSGLQAMTRALFAVSGRKVGEPLDLVTRPQSIFGKANLPHGEVMQTEAIHNPNAKLAQVKLPENHRARSVATEIEVVRSIERGKNREEAEKSSRKTPSGKLTRVTLAKRLQKSRFFQRTRELVVKIRSYFSQSPMDEPILPSSKRWSSSKYYNRARLLRIVMLTLLCVLVIIFSVRF